MMWKNHLVKFMKTKLKQKGNHTMKKRIFSLFLAVVMLFSSLSLEAFATESDAPEAQASTGQTVVKDTIDPHTGQEIKAAIEAVKTLGTTASYSDGTTGIVEGSNTSIKYENGKNDGRKAFLRCL